MTAPNKGTDEPVAWRIRYNDKNPWAFTLHSNDADAAVTLGYEVEPLYTRAPAQDAAVAELRRDADRYRWMRTWFLRDGRRAEIAMIGHVKEYTPPEIDEAIDAALAANKATPT